MLTNEMRESKNILLKVLIYLSKIDGIVSEKELNKIRIRLMYTGLFTDEEIRESVDLNIDSIEDVKENIKEMSNTMFIKFTELCIELIISDRNVNDREISALHLILSQRLPYLQLRTLTDYLDAKKKVLKYEMSMFCEM